MKRRIVFIVGCWILLSGQACTPMAGHQVIEAPKLNGLSYAAAPRLLTAADVEAMQKLHANAVALMPYAFMRGQDTLLHYNTKQQWAGETVQGIAQEIDLLHAAGLQVMLKPHVWISHGMYTGNFTFENKALWRPFEASFKAYLLTFARLAQTKQVEVFCVGTEWRSFIKERPAFWEELIKDVRKVYTGKVTYAANWDEYAETPFWDALDYIGVNAYFPLSEDPNPPADELLAAWEPIALELQELSIAYHRPVIFTEYGYRSMDGATHKPWEANTNAKVSLTAQSKALEALYKTYWRKEWFAGGFLWKWFHRLHHAGGAQHNGFTPQGKPAEDIIKKYYNQAQ